MGTFIITTIIIGVCAWVFQIFWRAVLRFCFYLLQRSIDVVKKIITTTKKTGKAVMYLYRRYKNGKVIKTTVEPDEEEVDVDMLPQGLQDELDVHEEVIVRKDDIDPAEF